MKVQDLARELRQKTRDFIQFLNEMDIKVKSGNTKLDYDTVKIIRELIEDQRMGRNKADEEEIERRDVVLMDEALTVGDLIEKLEANTSDVMRAILEKGLLLNLNSSVDHDTAIEIADAIHIDLDFDDVETDEGLKGANLKEQLDEIEAASVDAATDLIKRPPVIALMGHVDHGKTSLLDRIRSSAVADRESGGITQHIGAYQIQHQDNALTFLDTPGHAAFTSLRARGARVTDIAILVVAADDGVKPQTIEAIDHAKAAEVPIIVALNKADKPEANLEQAKQQLSQHELVSEDWGGDTVMVPVSAKTGEGIDQLLEMILLVADVQELQANPSGAASGVIIESNLSKQKGALATVLVKAGLLSIGDHFVVGPVYGKVRALVNDQGANLDSAGPGMPVELLGLSEVPAPGDILEVYASEKEAKQVAASREDTAVKTGPSSLKTVSLETLSKQIESGDTKQLNLIIKADVNGSLEAIVASVQQLPTDEVSIHILHAATGPITENDIMLAKASEAYIISFNVPVTGDVQQLASEAGVTVKEYSVIYTILDDIKLALEGMFSIQYDEVESGKVEVRDIFKFSRVGAIAGSYVLEGTIYRNGVAELFRNGESLFKGKILSLKRFKDDVKEVASGYECGIVLDGFDNVQVGDSIVCYQVHEKRRTL